MKPNHLRTTRTARYYTIGGERDRSCALWLVLHGYGQTARSFLDAFEPVAGDGRLIVAPEALSRFYAGGTSGRVGASWMTSEDRRHEISDYLAYLDTLMEQVGRRKEERSGEAALHVLGFSQGAATAGRFVAHRIEQDRPVDRLTLWAGALPPEVEPDALGSAALTLVVGSEDRYVTPEHLAAQRRRLDDAGRDYRLLRFDGGHRLDDDMLRTLADDHG